MSTIQLPTDIVRESVAISADAAALAEKVAADRQQVEAMAPLVADTLIENGFAEPSNKEATVKMLTDPVSALKAISAMAKSASTPAPMGTAVTEKSSGYEPRTERRPSDVAFEEAFS